MLSYGRTHGMTFCRTSVKVGLVVQRLPDEFGTSSYNKFKPDYKLCMFNLTATTTTTRRNWTANGCREAKIAYF